VVDPRRGRPSTRLRINDQASTVVVADLGRTHGRLAVSTAAGEVISEMVIESLIDKGPSTVLDMVTSELDGLLKQSGRPPESLRGVALGVPGPVDWHSGRIARSISMPGWDNYPVRDHLTSHYAVPALVDNDANLLGLGEQRRIYPSAHLVLFVKVGTGIGASMIIDGDLLRGSDAAEGDIGHAKIPASMKPAAVAANVVAWQLLPVAGQWFVISGDSATSRLRRLMSSTWFGRVIRMPLKS
jgi:predicted NBD/HSP70 family sugar kinase